MLFMLNLFFCSEIVFINRGWVMNRQFPDIGPRRGASKEARPPLVELTKSAPWSRPDDVVTLNVMVAKTETVIYLSKRMMT